MKTIHFMPVSLCQTHTLRLYLASVIVSGGFCAPALADLGDLQFTNPIERAAALANQATYDLLTSGPNPTCAPQIEAPTGACSGAVFETFANVRELVETANDLTDPNAPTRFSLGLDQEGLGFALRWTAAEELAAQGSSLTQFTNSQLNSLASRVSALRAGALGLADNGRSNRSLWAQGGGASGDESIVNRWGGMINGAFGYGRKDDTSDPFDTTGTSGAEDAFDFDGSEITIGIDYRARSNLVFGALLGRTERRIDFDSSVSIVDGTIDTDGLSLMLFALWERDRFYVTGSVGFQELDYELTRRITYPSLNPLVAPVDVTTTSDSSSDSLSATINAGVPLTAGGFTFEPFAKAEYQKATVDAFAEEGSTGFELGYDEQDIKSFELTAGIKLQYVINTPVGVIVPYARGEFRKELESDGRVISATFAGTPTAGSDESFALSTDELDDQFTVAAGGFSMVFKRGLQAFLQYQQVFDLDTYDDRVIAAGVRLEY